MNELCFIDEGKNASNHILVMFGGWKSEATFFKPLVPLWSRLGFKMIVVTFSPEILSTDPITTRKNILTATKKLATYIKQLKAPGVRISLFGSSLGAFMALGVAENTTHIDDLILNVIGVKPHQIVWSWEKSFGKYKEFHNELLAKKISITDLAKHWNDFSPEKKLKKLKTKNILMFLNQDDNIIPYQYQKELLDEFNKYGHKVKVVDQKGGRHYLACSLNILYYRRYLTWLRENGKDDANSKVQPQKRTPLQIKA